MELNLLLFSIKLKIIPRTGRFVLSLLLLLSVCVRVCVCWFAFHFHELPAVATIVLVVCLCGFLFSFFLKNIFIFLYFVRFGALVVMLRKMVVY